MTKEKFNKKFPNGLNKVITYFEKSVHEIMTTDEIDKVIKTTRGKEKRELVRLKKYYQEQVKDWGDAPIWCLMPAIQSKELFKDIIAHMVTKCDEIYHGENEE